MAAAGLQVLHFSGTTDHDEVVERYAGATFPHHVAAFCSEMGTAYRAADLALARSGASSLAELASFGLPAVLVPFPFAADDHQKKNAEVAVRAGAAVLAEEDVLGGDRLGQIVTEIFAGRDRLRGMAERSLAMANPGAARRIADVIEKTCARS
jgi:UDP-N-acetylglucosamine--N-acetylmuramyl-(pentapeptide) pyrophosphoryl-undecaprenol N-acetylglucosamine transferase